MTNSPVQIRAAIVWEQGAPLSVESAELDAPGPGEVLVEVKAAGVCHSDLHATSGDWPMGVPLVPGHEGAGIVRGVGEGVTRAALGDHVVLCWAPACGQCDRAGRVLRCCAIGSRRRRFATSCRPATRGCTRKGQEVAPFLGTACFASHTVVPQEASVPCSDEVPFEALAAVGCAVVTGVGAVSNAARVPPGAVVAVIGAGGVGLNVVQGAVLAGAARIIADRPRSRRR